MQRGIISMRESSRFTQMAIESAANGVIITKGAKNSKNSNSKGNKLVAKSEAEVAENQLVLPFEVDCEPETGLAPAVSGADSYPLGSSLGSVINNITAGLTSISNHKKHTTAWPIGVPLPAGYSVYDFERFRPHLNMFREYQISYQPSLWEDYSAYRMWGKRGQAKQWRSNSFASEAEVLGWIQRMVLRRLRKGYKLASWYVQE